MKLKFESFEGLDCLSIRGEITADQLRLISVGLDVIIRRLEQPLAINMTLATKDPTMDIVLASIKKKYASAKQKVYWLYKDRQLGDFPNIDLLASRMPGSKIRLIADRIRFDDEIFALTEKIHAFENREKEIEASGTNTHNLILENLILKEQKKILSGCVAWHEERLGLQKPVSTENTDIITEAETIAKQLRDIFGYEVGL